MSKFTVLYLVTFFHVSSQGQFDVFHRDSFVRSLLKAHDVIENKRVSALFFFVKCQRSGTVRQKDAIIYINESK